MSEESPITGRDILGFSHYSFGVPFYGSFRGMRYMVARDPLKDPKVKEGEEKPEPVLKLIIWPGPFSLEKTAEEEKESFRFDFTEEGFEALLAKLNESYVNRKGYWNELDTIRV
ncbi:MAG: hypothetical protein K5985_12505 [Lachnospiraceae bacterium]|nr:hypothetical protein [Lachnospiraceae bacterium]